MLETVVEGSVKETDGSVTEDVGKSLSSWSPCTGFTRLERLSCKGPSLVGSLSVTTVGVEGGIGSVVRSDAESSSGAEPSKCTSLTEDLWSGLQSSCAIDADDFGLKFK